MVFSTIGFPRADNTDDRKNFFLRKANEKWENAIGKLSRKIFTLDRCTFWKNFNISKRFHDLCFWARGLNQQFFIKKLFIKSPLAHKKGVGTF